MYLGIRSSYWAACFEGKKFLLPTIELMFRRCTIWCSKNGSTRAKLFRKHISRLCPHEDSKINTTTIRGILSRKLWHFIKKTIIFYQGIFLSCYTVCIEVVILLSSRYFTLVFRWHFLNRFRGTYSRILSDLWNNFDSNFKSLCHVLIFCLTMDYKDRQLTSEVGTAEDPLREQE